MNFDKVIYFLSKHKIVVTIIIGLISAIFLYFQTFIIISPVYKFFIIVILPLSSQIIDYIINRYNTKKRLDTIENMLLTINYFFINFLGDKRIIDNLKFLKKKFYLDTEKLSYTNLGYEIFDKYYENDDSVYLVYLCFLIDSNFKVSTKNKARFELSSMFENYGIRSLKDLENSEIKNVLKYFPNYINKKKLNSNLEYNSEKVFEYFTKMYLSTLNAYHILNLKGEKIIEFNRTLSRLVDSSKISKKNIMDDINRFENYNAYLLLSNLLEDNENIKNKINKLEHIDFRGTLGENKFKSKIIFLKNKLDPNEFLKTNFGDFYQKNEKIPGIVGLFPIEIKDLFLFPFNIDKIIDDEKHLRTNYNKLKEYYLLALSGNNNVALNNSTIRVSEILSNIPLNIFIPKVKKEIRDFIIDNYQDLKVKFEINTIYDWAEVEFSDLANYFIKKDINEITNKEKWLELSELIITEVEKIKEATTK